MVQSPYTVKTIARATPMTAAMQMYNWLSEKIKLDQDENSKSVNLN